MLCAKRSTSFQYGDLLVGCAAVFEIYSITISSLYTFGIGGWELVEMFAPGFVTVIIFNTATKSADVVLNH
jgi:hypothetical protein